MGASIDARLRALAPWIGGLAFAVAAVVLGWLAYEAIFARFPIYDDEGYVLISLASFLDGHALYDEVYSQYGPAYYVLVGGAFELLGITVNHDNGRLLAMGLWVAGSLLTGIGSWRLTRSLPVGLAATALAFYALSVATNEPPHPGNLLGLLIGATVALCALLARRPRIALAALGAVAMLMVLTKVNVGGYAVAALVFAVVSTSPALARVGWLRALVAVALVACPLVVLASGFDLEFVGATSTDSVHWAPRFAATIGIGAAAVAAASLRLGPAPGLDGRALASLACGAGAVTAVVLLVLLVLGTSPAGIVEGIVLEPLGQVDAFVIPLVLPGTYPLIAAAGLAAALVATWALGRSAPEGGAPRAVSGILRLAAGLAIWYAVARGSIGAVPPTAYLVGASLCWVAALPTVDRTSGWEAFVRAFLPALAVLELLHAYPVAGSQIGWGVLTLVPVGAICVGDAIRELGPLVRSGLGSPLPARAAIAAPAILFCIWVVAVPLRERAEYFDDIYEAGVPSELRGASRLHLSPPASSTLHALVDRFERRCETLFTFPGMNSFYFFTGTPPPTTLNVTDWMDLLDAAQQREVVDRLEDAPGLCVIARSDGTASWAQGRPLPERPLLTYLYADAGLEEIGTYGPYKLQRARR